MKKRILLSVLTLILALVFAFALASCDSSDEPTQKPTGNPTETPTEQSCAHAYDNTCDADCNLCGETREASHTAKVVDAVAPTCTQLGLTEGSVCSVCNATLTAQKTVAAKGHNEVIDESVSATCSKTGLTQGSHCDVCGEVLVAQEEVSKKAHLTETVASVKPTCTETGLTKGERCLICGEFTVAQTVVPATGHNEKVIEAVAPTCTTTGLTEGSECKTCGEIIVASDVIDALGHDFPETYSTDAQNHWKRCGRRNCGVIVEKNAHTFVKYNCTTCNYYNGPKVHYVETYDRFIGQSLDTLFAAYDQIAGAGKNIAVNDVTNIEIPLGENIKLNGWVGFSGLKIQSFGYWFNDDVYSVVTNGSYFLETEDDVLQVAGENARRFSILASTNGQDNIKSVSFVALLENGSYVVLKRIDVTMMGSLEPGEIIPDDEIVKAEAETLDYGIKFVARKKTGTEIYTTDAGLTYTVSGGTFVNGKFNVSKTESFKVIFDKDYDKFAANFNKYKLSYSSTVPMKAVVTYTDGDTVVTDIIFLEAGENLFSCLTLGYVNEIYAKNITSIEFQMLGTDQTATFLLYDVSTEEVETLSGSIKYLTNQRYALGINIKWGGGISFILDAEDGNDDVRNLINCADTGRLVQQSYYGTQTAGDNGYQLGEFHETAWGYNPVQGGNRYNEPSRIIDVQISGPSIYIKAQPRDWAQHHLTSSYMENVYTLYSDRIQVDNRFTEYSGFQKNPYRAQELPAFYTIGYLNTFVNYSGKTPWAGDELTYDDDLGFWTEDYNATKRFKQGNTETWCAWINQNDDYGIGVYTPNVPELFAGRLDYDVSPDEVESTAQACSYVAAIGYLRLANYEPMEYSYLITTGSTQEIRDLFTEHKDFADNADLSDPRFAK